MSPPPAVTPSIGRAITLSIHGDDTIAATSQRISESLAEANAGVAAPVRIFHKGYELTDADLQRTVSQASILPESTLFVLPTAGDEAEALRLAAGPLCRDVLAGLDAAVAAPASKPTLTLLSGHDTTVKPLLVALGVYDHKWPPFCACVVVASDLHRSEK